ncbi:MAG: SDR family NAD(P)-dependent oxidoreductase [Pseudomonadales bacterium]|nr:SDR family NAD(P)-dependent oxidoreductase [Pseudomonadales bacterium]
MLSVERTFTVAKPVAEAYHYLLDFSNTEQWDVNVLRAEKLTPGKPGKDTRFALLAKTGPGTSPLVYRITETTPPHTLTLEASAANFSLRDNICFKAIDQQHTEICYHIDMQAHQGIAKLAKYFPSTLDHLTDKALAGLTRALNDQHESIEDTYRLGDKLLLPAILDFTRRGYLKAKRHWKGLAANLSCKTAVVTGATSGLGKETAMALAKMGANVIVVARDTRKADELKDLIFLETGNTIQPVIADLSLIKETKLAANTIATLTSKIDILVNNAGALFNQRNVTEEGHEQSFALLLLSPFVLTEMLIPQLRAAASGARVINVSSGGMYTQPICLQDLNYETGTYDGPKAYARAKRGLVDITSVWSRRYLEQNITFNAMHPGWADTPAVASSLPRFYKVTKPYLRTPKEGADTIIWLAAANDVQGISGRFWLDRQPRPTAVFPGTATPSEQQERLYSVLGMTAADHP